MSRLILLFSTSKSINLALGVDHANNIKIEEKDKNEFDGYFDSSITSEAQTNYLR
jgi:hypothetical protein